MSCRGSFTSILLGGAISLATLACGAPASEEAERVIVEIPSGSSFPTVLDSLASKGVIQHRRLFHLYARLRRADRGIRSGTYSLGRGQSWGDIIDDLTAGRVMTVSITIPEGYTLRQIAGRLHPVTHLPADSTLTLLMAMDPAAFDVPGPTLEGYLFPDTYRLTPGASLEGIVRVMTARYHEIWTANRSARLDSLAMTERGLLSLASIVQAEARVLSEMPIIAAVYHNRLRRGYPLQADPTVLYALGGPRERLLYAAMDSVADHPYNTYTHPGLPPGPIGAPGAAAIDAALHPDTVDYLYFVARPDGTHIFSRTLEEHNQAVAKARREREEQKRDQNSGRTP